MTIKVHTFTAPSAWASYLINGGDPAQYDITEADKAAADAWVESVGLGPPVSCEDAGFLWKHDAFEFCPLGADCQEYVFYEHVEEAPCPDCRGTGRGGPNTTDGGKDDDCCTCSGEGVSE